MYNCHIRWGKERGDVEYTKTRGFNPRGNIEHMQGRHSITDKTQTERTGDYKDRLTRELRRHTWDQIKQSDWGETGSQVNTTKQSRGVTIIGLFDSVPGGP